MKKLRQILGEGKFTPSEEAQLRKEYGYAHKSELSHKIEKLSPERQAEWRSNTGSRAAPTHEISYHAPDGRRVTYHAVKTTKHGEFVNHYGQKARSLEHLAKLGYKHVGNFVRVSDLQPRES